MPEKSGNREYPKTYSIDLDGIGNLSIKSYIWPKNSKSPEYKMNGSAATSQGFYWYRSDRLINQDGWNRLRDTEPHTSLARACIDLPPELDSVFGLQVGKYKVEPPKLFLNNVFDQALSKDGSNLRSWVNDANETYRKKPVTENSDVVFVPQKGFGNKKQIAALKKQFVIGKEEIMPIECKVKNLEENKIFEIDIDDYSITINKVLINEDMNKAALSAFKVSLFLLARNYFSFSVLNKKHQSEIDDINEYLIGIFANE